MSISEDQMDLRAEAFATLAKGKHPKTKEIQKSIDIKTFASWLSYVSCWTSKSMRTRYE